MSVCERFKTLVPIANPSGAEAEIRQVISDTLKGFGITDIDVDEAGNLFARVPGDAGKETILLSAHMDSVPPCHGIVPVEDTRDGRAIICSEGKTILGADDKSGIATILETVAILSQASFSGNHPLELMFSTCEEVGLIGAKAFDFGKIKAKYAYVLDGEGDLGDVFNAGPSQENVKITCHGRRAHAGIAPEAGISAVEMGAAICAAVPSGRLNEMTTTNIGLIKGGSAMNVVAPELTINAEARSHSEEDLKNLIETYRKTCEAIEKRFPGSKVEFTPLRRYDHFSVDPQHTVVQRALEVYKSLDVAAKVLPMFIGSDAHVLNHKGLPTVILGMGFHYSHSLGEYVYKDELEQVARAVLKLVSPTPVNFS